MAKRVAEGRTDIQRHQQRKVIQWTPSVPAANSHLRTWLEELIEYMVPEYGLGF